jgi:hypothetical protein
MRHRKKPARWAIRSTPEAVDAKRCRSELCVQLACGIRRRRRFRIAIINPKNPSPISMRP